MNNRPRSFFWPILLIGAGLVLLLANLNVIPLPSLAVLLRLWPVLLIVGGLDILFARRAPWISAVLALAAVAGAIAILIFAPALGLGNAPQAKTGRFNEPVGEAKSAAVTLDLSSAPATIHGLAGSSDLIDANLTYVGDIQFDVQGTTDKTIRLSNRFQDPFAWVDVLTLSPEVRWDIGLTPQIPLNLTVDGGSGSTDIDLAPLTLSGLLLDVGSGQIDLALPGTGDHYVARFDGGSGEITIQIPAGADVELHIDGGSGEMTLDVPDQAVRVEVRDSGSGAVRLPSGLTVVSSGENGEGAWETSDYGSASRRVDIVVEDGGSGSMTVR